MRRYSHKDNTNKSGTGYSHKNSWHDQGQEEVWVKGDWPLCAATCSEKASCQDWAYVYDGKPAVSKWKCRLKPDLDGTHPHEWEGNEEVISGLRKE